MWPHNMTFLAHDEHTVALLQAVIETTSEAVLVTDGTGKILLLNQRFSVAIDAGVVRDDHLARPHSASGNPGQ